MGWLLWSPQISYRHDQRRRVLKNKVSTKCFSAQENKEETREMQSPPLPPRRCFSAQEKEEKAREMQSPRRCFSAQEKEEETREMQSLKLPPQPQSPQPQPPEPTPASPSLPPSPDPKLPSHAQEEISPASPHPFSSSAPPSSSSLSGGMPAHHPSPPPSKPASSKLLAMLRKIKIDVIFAILNILAQSLSAVLERFDKGYRPFFQSLGFLFAMAAIPFGIAELWWMRKRKIPIGSIEYAESAMAIIQLALSVLEVWHLSDNSVPYMQYSSALVLALLLGYSKVTKKVGRWHHLEMDDNSVIVIRIDCLETAPREVGKWLYNNRVQDVHWESVDSLARLFGPQRS